MKRWKYYTAVLLGAALMTIGMTGCGATDKGVGAAGTGEKSASKQSETTAEKGTKETTEEATEQLPAYVPVNPDDVPENAEDDFIFEVDQYGHGTISGYRGSATQVKVPANLGGADRILIKTDVFQKNQNITYVYLPETVIGIGEEGFYGCDALEELYIAGSATIPKGLCEYDKNLRRVVMEQASLIDGEKEYGAFYKCTSLTDVVFPETLKGIGFYAFAGCSQLRAVDLSSTQVEELGGRAFGECDLLEEVKLPGSVTKLYAGAFYNCQSLKSFLPGDGSTIEVEDGLVYDGDTLLFGLIGLEKEEAVIREGTVKVEDWAFMEDKNLKKVVFPDSISKIGDLVRVFYGNEVITYKGTEYQPDPESWKKLETAIDARKKREPAAAAQ